MIFLRATLLVSLLLLTAGCPEKKSGAPSEEERTLQKLKEAQAMGGDVQGPPTPQENPNEKLAAIAAQGSSDESGARPLPAKNETVHLGTVALKVVGVSTSPIVTGTKLQLTTDQTFLIVRLYAQNVGEREQELDLSMAAVKGDGELDFALARDAQRVAGTKELRQTFGPAASAQRQELVLIFEVPKGSFGKGLKLVLTSPGVDPVTLPLE